MSKIIEGSKTIAKYLDWVYIPSNNLQGFPKAGWYQTKVRKKSEITTESGKKVDTTGFSDSINTKIGWFIVNENYVKFVCRNHNQLRFYNSMDALVPVIEKLENEDLSEFHYDWEDSRGEHNNFMRIEFSRFGDQSSFDIDLQLDPCKEIGSHKGEGIVKDTFHATVEAINYINKLRNNE